MGASRHTKVLRQNNPHDINHGTYSNLLPWGLLGRQVLALAVHTQVPLFTEPFSNGFWYKTPSWFTNQPQQSTKISLHRSPCTFNLFLWPDRWTVPTSPQYLSPSTLADNTQTYLSQTHFLTRTHIVMKAALCKIARLHPQVVTHGNRLVECSPHTPGL